MRSFETPNGKQIAMVICPKTAHIKVQFTSGGELPVELSGLYTSQTDAEKDIMIYLDKLNSAPKEKAKKETIKEE